MIIDSQIHKYIVFAEDSIVTALQKISKNKSRIVFSVTESGRLEGVLSDGDFRRWLLSQPVPDLNVQVREISQKTPVSAPVDASRDKINSLFSQRVTLIPLIDDHQHLVAIARPRAAEIHLGKFTLDANSPCLTIAEVGNNHNGCLELAMCLVDEAIKAGADCVKFQMRSIEKLYRNAGNPNDSSEDLGSQYTLDLLSRFNLPADDLFSVFDYAQEKGIMPLCTPWDEDSVDALQGYGVPGFKVASADLTSHDLLRAIAETGKPVLLSTGMSTEPEIKESVGLLQDLGTPYILLHCNSTYPAPFKDVQLSYMARLGTIGNCLVGYSGHERGINVAIAAAALGAKVIEKHFTLDRSMEGNDHKISLLPDEFKAMVSAIREVEEALGSNDVRKMSQGEMINRDVLAKSLVASRDLRKGELIENDAVAVRSPGRGLQPNQRRHLVGRKARRDIAANDFFYPSDLRDVSIEPRQYRFRRPWGIPVRYHDVSGFLEQIQPDFFEYHLSYKDMEMDIDAIFDGPLSTGLVVHAPELFSGDHIMDLCADDESYRRRSIDECQRVIDVTRALRRYHRVGERTLIIANVGGFTMDRPLKPDARHRLYERVLEALQSLDSEETQIIPQTMPPFPWHFGGQRYHNLFVDPDEIAEFCAAGRYKICLDVSHSKLACNHFAWSWSEFLSTVAPFAAHLHLCDASGVDGEGLQIGEGDIDFASLAEICDRAAADASFVPEVWQGHKNNGEGFWIALDRLDRWF